MRKTDFQQVLRQLKMNIAYYRKKAGHTQEQFANMIFTSRTHLSQIEALGTNLKPSLELLFVIADALDIDFIKLFEEK